MASHWDLGALSCLRIEEMAVSFSRGTVAVSLSKGTVAVSLSRGTVAERNGTWGLGGLVGGCDVSVPSAILIGVMYM